MRYSYSVFSLLFLLLFSQANYSQEIKVKYFTDHVDTALRYDGIREATNKNDGYYVEKFLKSVKLKKGFAWCAAFVSYCLEASKSRFKIRSARSKDFITKNSIKASEVLAGTASVKKGFLVIWTRQTGGHIGIATDDWKGSSGNTIEGNTSPARGSQFEGDGAYRKFRKIEPLNYFRIINFTPVVE